MKRLRGLQTPPAPADGSSLWSELRLMLSNRRGAIIALAIASVVSGLTESGILAIVAQAAAAMVNRASRVSVDLGAAHIQESVGLVLAFGFALLVLRLVLQVVISVVPARIATEMQAKLRTETLAAFSGAAWNEQSRDREGLLQELLTNQVSQATQSSVQAATLLVTSLTFAVLVVSAFVLNVLAALVVLVTAIGLFGLMRPITNLIRRLARTLSQASIDYAGGINETVRLAEETHVFGAATAQRQRAQRLVTAVSRPYYQVQMLSRLVPGVYQNCVYLLVVLALFALYVVGGGHAASLGAVVLLLVRAGMYGQQMQTAYQAVLVALPFVDRIQAAQQRYAGSSPTPGSLRLTGAQTLAFERVSFAYETGRPVLSNIDFEVTAGESVGIVGPSGAGKSTLVQILLGLRSPQSGRYLVNGVPAEQFKRTDWHGRIAYVPQEPRLLHASVSDNIRFFRDIDDATLERAARLAGIHDDVVKMSAGYETLIGPRADAISGGQQQRICLARALAGNPEILVLDEPTSALDPRTDLLIQESLAALKYQFTMFVVAHRMSMLDVCDRVMVLVDGRLEAFGSMDELQSSSVYYRAVSDLGRRAPKTVHTR